MSQTEPGDTAVTFPAPIVTSGFAPLAGPTCTPSSGSTFSPGTTTVNCTVSDAKQRTSTCAFSVTIVLPPKLTIQRFLAFGDSMTFGEDGANSLSGFSAGQSRPAVQFPFSQTYPGALQADLRGRYVTQSPTVGNAGKPSESVLDSTTYPRYTAFISSGLYDSVLIMDGANDLGDRDASIEPAVIASLKRMIDDAKSRGMRPILGTLPPANPNGCCPMNRGLAWSLVPGFNDRLRDLASSEGIPLADVYQAFNGDVTTLIGPDGLHPTAAGYDRIASTFAAAIRGAFETTALAPSLKRSFCGPAIARCNGRSR
jgi:lysophospholipase L1-like esterase